MSSNLLNRNEFFVHPELCIDYVQVHVDAASPLDQTGAAVGAVAIDNQGRWLGSAYRKERWHPPLEAEMGSIFLGLKLVAQVKASKVLILSDSL